MHLGSFYSLSPQYSNIIDWNHSVCRVLCLSVCLPLCLSVCMHDICKKDVADSWGVSWYYGLVVRSVKFSLTSR